MNRIIHNPRQNMTAKFDAFPYQHEAFMAVRDLDYAAIFHEQGLGKTKIAIDLMLYWMECRNIDTVLVVTKKTLVNNWVEEFAAHTNLRSKVLGTNKGANFYAFNSASRVIFTNFETISGEKDRFSLFLKTRNVAIVIDESTKIKNPDAKLTRDFFELAPLFKIRVIMTGTPVANRPYDVWAQIYFLDNGESLGADFKEFKKACDLSNDLETDDDKKDNFESVVSQIYTRIKPFTVRETKNSGIISLPKKNYHDIIVDFEKKQREMYEHLRREMFLLVLKGDETILDESPEAIKRLLRLVQLASNPALIDDNYTGPSAKELKLEELLGEIAGRDEQAIVWSIFTDNVGALCSRYKSYGSVKITGKMSNEDRIRSVQKFKSGEAKFLFATPQSAKEGLTLTMANHAVFYDRGFNLDDYLQAQDRIHRISQKKECHIYNLMIADSIDIWINQLLGAKQQAAYLAQGDIALDKYKAIADYSFATLVREILNTPQ